MNVIRSLALLTLPLALTAGTCQAQTVLLKPVAPVEANLFLTLPGHLAPSASVAQELGRVAAAMPFEHFAVQLQRSAAQEAALDQVIDDLHHPNSPFHHQWMAVEEHGERLDAIASQIAQ